MVTKHVCTDKVIFLGWSLWGSRWSCCTLEHDARQALSSFELGNKVLSWQQMEKCKTTPEMVCLHQVLLYKMGIGVVGKSNGGAQVFQQGRLRKQILHCCKRGGRQKGTCNAWDAEEWRKAGCEGCENGTKSWRKRGQGFHNGSAHYLPVEGN